MSNAVTAACRPLQMPPTAKAVLMCMADYADDGGRCWPSIDTLAAWTCFGRTAVIGAIRWLEASGVLVADRSNGRHTSYCITATQFNQSVSRTGPSPGPVRLPNGTSTAGVLHQSVSRTAPVRQADSNHQEPSVPTNKATTKRVAHVDLPEWLPRKAWADWCDHRKSTKNAMTPKAAELSIARLADFREQGFSPETVINNAIERGWRGLYAPSQPTTTTTTGKPSAAADFRGKTYAGTAIDDLPPDLRDAARAALAED